MREISERRPEMDQLEETYDGEFVICPWCKAKMGDAWEWCRQEPREDKCSECGKKFIYWADVSVEYRARPILAAPPEDERTEG